jgi:hypothetical protein
MGHLYYTELGNSAGGPLNKRFTDGLTGETEFFLNLQPSFYWSGTECGPGDGTGPNWPKGVVYKIEAHFYDEYPSRR